LGLLKTLEVVRLRHNVARRTQVKLDGFRVGSAAPKRFWRVSRRTNVGFQMPEERPHCLPGRVWTLRFAAEDLRKEGWDAEVTL
jgi:hypothetical protein